MQVSSVRLLILLSIFLNSCSILYKNKTESQSIWVNSYRKTCTGEGEFMCLQVYEGQDVEKALWGNFYDEIIGFEFEPGYLYHLQVGIKALKDEDVPADGSSLVYTLEKVLEKREDVSQLVGHVWDLEMLLEETWDADPAKKTNKRPDFQLDGNTWQVSGNDGCNGYFGQAKRFDGQHIQLGAMGGTRMACPNMETSDIFNAKLALIASYERKGDNLRMFDASGREVLLFKKRAK